MATVLLSQLEHVLSCVSCLRLLILLLASLLLADHAYHNLPTGRDRLDRAVNHAARHIRSLLTASTSSLLHPPSPRPLS